MSIRNKNRFKFRFLIISIVCGCHTWSQLETATKTSSPKGSIKPSESASEFVLSSLTTNSQAHREKIAVLLEDTLRHDSTTASNDENRRIFDTQLRTAIKGLRLGSDACKEEDRLLLYRLSSNASDRNVNGKPFSLSSGIRLNQSWSIYEDLRALSPSLPMDFSQHAKAHNETPTKSFYLSATLNGNELTQSKNNDVIQVIKLCPGRYFPFVESDLIKHEVLIFGFILPEEIESESDAKSFDISKVEPSPLALCEHFHELEYSESFRTTFEGLSKDFMKIATSSKSDSPLNMRRVIELQTQTGCTCATVLDASNEIATFSGLPQKKAEYCESKVKLMNFPVDSDAFSSPSLTDHSQKTAESCHFKAGQLIKYFLVNSMPNYQRVWLVEPIPNCPPGPLYFRGGTFPNP